MSLEPTWSQPQDTDNHILIRFEAFWWETADISQWLAGWAGFDGSGLSVASQPEYHPRIPAYQAWS